MDTSSQIPTNRPSGDDYSQHENYQNYESARKKRKLDKDANPATADATNPNGVQVTMTPNTATVSQAGQVLGTVSLTNMGVVYEDPKGNRVTMGVPNLPPPAVAANAAQVSPNTISFLQGTNNQAVVSIPNADSSSGDVLGTKTVPVNFWDMMVEVMIMLNKSSTEISNISMLDQRAQGMLAYKDTLRQADKQMDAAKKTLAADYTQAATSAVQGAGTVVATSASAASQRSAAQKAQKATPEEQQYSSKTASQDYVNEKAANDPNYVNAVNAQADTIQANSPGTSRADAISEAKANPNEDVKAQYDTAQSKSAANYQTQREEIQRQQSARASTAQNAETQKWAAWSTAFNSFSASAGGTISATLKYEAAEEQAQATRIGASATTHQTAAGMEAQAQKSAQDSMSAFQQSIQKLMELLAGFWNPSGFRA